jgi:hypothetical protein
MFQVSSRYVVELQYPNYGGRPVAPFPPLWNTIRATAGNLYKISVREVLLRIEVGKANNDFHVKEKVIAIGAKL